MTYNNYPLGTLIVFRAPNGNACNGQDSLSEGVVNGKPMVIEGETESVTLIPLFCRRAQGREPTTIFVDSRNILEVSE